MKDIKTEVDELMYVIGDKYSSTAFDIDFSKVKDKKKLILMITNLADEFRKLVPNR